ncbi:MAG: TIGR03668 family PPOX class F420-dependent oxidoreductase [Acidobacteriota bacterium]
MPLDIDESTQEFIRRHRVARLATSDTGGQPAVVPICYAFDGERFYVALDEKPKSVADHELKRVRNIRANPRVAIVIDDYSEDWNKLIYVLVSGTGEILSPAEDASEHARAVELLREKYPQYRSMAIDERPMIKVTPARFKRWGPLSAPGSNGRV